MILGAGCTEGLVKGSLVDFALVLDLEWIDDSVELGFEVLLVFDLNAEDILILNCINGLLLNFQRIRLCNVKSRGRDHICLIRLLLYILQQISLTVSGIKCF